MSVISSDDFNDDDSRWDKFQSVPGGPDASRWLGSNSDMPRGGMPYSGPLPEVPSFQHFGDTYTSGINYPQYDPTSYANSFTLHSAKWPESYQSVKVSYTGDDSSHCQDESDGVCLRTILILLGVCLIAAFQGGAIFGRHLAASTSNQNMPTYAALFMFAVLAFTSIDGRTPSWIKHVLLGGIVAVLTAFPLCMLNSDLRGTWLFLELHLALLFAIPGYLLRKELVSYRPKVMDFHPRFLWFGAYFPLLTFCTGLLSHYGWSWWIYTIGVVTLIYTNSIWVLHKFESAVQKVEGEEI